MTTEQNHHGVGLGRDETQQEDILRAAVVTFEHGVSQRGALVQLDLLVSGTDQVVDDVRRGGVASRAAEPLAAGKALDHTAGGMDATVSSEGQNQSLEQMSVRHRQQELTRTHERAIPSPPQRERRLFP